MCTCMCVCMRASTHMHLRASVIGMGQQPGVHQGGRPAKAPRPCSYLSYQGEGKMSTVVLASTLEAEFQQLPAFVRILALVLLYSSCPLKLHFFFSVPKADKSAQKPSVLLLPTAVCSMGEGTPFITTFSLAFLCVLCCSAEAAQSALSSSSGGIPL